MWQDYEDYLDEAADLNEDELLALLEQELGIENEEEFDGGCPHCGEEMTEIDHGWTSIGGLPVTRYTCLNENCHCQVSPSLWAYDDYDAVCSASINRR